MKCIIQPPTAMSSPEVIFVCQIQIGFQWWFFVVDGFLRVCFGVFFEVEGRRREGRLFLDSSISSVWRITVLCFLLNALIDITHYEALCCEV